LPEGEEELRLSFRFLDFTTVSIRIAPHRIAAYGRIQVRERGWTRVRKNVTVFLLCLLCLCALSLSLSQTYTLSVTPTLSNLFPHQGPTWALVSVSCRGPAVSGAAACRSDLHLALAPSSAAARGRPHRKRSRSPGHPAGNNGPGGTGSRTIARAPRKPSRRRDGRGGAARGVENVGDRRTSTLCRPGQTVIGWPMAAHPSDVA
jgi:hypothetical protein